MPETVAPAAYQTKKAEIAQIVQQQAKDIVKAKNLTEAQNLQEKQPKIADTEELSGVLYDATETAKSKQSIVAQPEKLYQWKAEEVYTKSAEKAAAVSQEKLFSEEENQEKNKDTAYNQLTEKLKQKKKIKLY